MGNWIQVRIEEMCSLGRGRVISTHEVAENPGSYPVYSSQSTNNGEMGRIATYDFEGEYVTWTTDGANAGTVFYRNGKFNCTNVCGTLLSKRKLSMPFLAYVLGSVAKNYVSYVGNPKLMNNIVAKIEIRIPDSFSEQITIATILTTIDQSIEKTEQLIAKYERIKTGLMQDLLTRGIDEKGNIRNENTHEFKDSMLGRIPKEWEVVLARNLSKRICVGFVGTCEKYYTNPSVGVPMLRTGNLHNGELDFSELKYVTFAFHISNKKSQLRNGDILVARHGESGQSVLYETNFSEANCLNIVIIRPDLSQVTSKYFRNYLNSEIVKKQVENKKGGTTQSVVNTKEIENLLIAFPSHQEQERIDLSLNTIDSFLDGEIKNLEKQKNQKSALMQDLLTGNVRVDTLLKK